jgi:MFS family permease
LKIPSIIVAITFAATMAATTVSSPLYPGYVVAFGLSPLDITVVFAVYGAAVMFGLAVFGRLSDHYGRKPPLAVALAVGIVAMAVFVIAQGLGLLLVARALIGLTAGVYTGTATAWLVDLDVNRVRATKLAIAANLGGLGMGPLLAGALAQWAPRPLRTVYVVELVLLALGLVAHRWLPETVTRERFALDFGDLLPPREILAVFIPAATAGIAAFGCSGVLGATAPAMLREVFGIGDPLAVGVLLWAMFTAGVGGQFLARRVPPSRGLVLGCFGLVAGVALLAVALEAEILIALILSAVISGLAMGVIIGAGLGLLTGAAPAERRGQVASAYFLATYIGLVVPVVGFGLVETSTGLVTAGLIFSGVVAVAALASAAGVQRYRPSG